MSQTITFDARIRGGLPVLVEATIYPPEPDVGIFERQVEIDQLYWLPKARKSKLRLDKLRIARRAKLCPLPAHIELSDKDRDDLIQQALEEDNSYDYYCD